MIRASCWRLGPEGCLGFQIKKIFLNILISPFLFTTCKVSLQRFTQNLSSKLCRLWFSFFGLDKGANFKLVPCNFWLTCVINFHANIAQYYILTQKVTNRNYVVFRQYIWVLDLNKSSIFQACIIHINFSCFFFRHQLDCSWRYFFSNNVRIPRNKI